MADYSKVKTLSKINCEVYRKFKKVNSLNDLTGLEKKIASYMCRLALEERQLYEPRIEVENGFISKKLNINYESYKKIIQRLKKKNFIIASVRSQDRKRVIYFINSFVYADSLPRSN